jgi:hypothetical protein
MNRWGYRNGWRRGGAEGVGVGGVVYKGLKAIGSSSEILGDCLKSSLTTQPPRRLQIFEPVKTLVQQLPNPERC